MSSARYVWDYRVVRCRRRDQETYQIHRIGYNAAGQCPGSTPAGPSAGSVEELRGELEYMLAALSKPVLEEADL